MIFLPLAALAIGFGAIEKIVLDKGTVQQKQLQEQRFELYAALLPAIFWLVALQLVELDLNAIRRFPFNVLGVQLPEMWLFSTVLSTGCKLVAISGLATVLCFLLVQPRLSLSPEVVNDYGWLRGLGSISSLLGAVSLTLAMTPGLVGLAGMIVTFGSVVGIRQNRNGYRDLGQPSIAPGNLVRVSIVIAGKNRGGVIAGASIPSGISVKALMDPSYTTYYRIRQRIRIEGTVKDVSIHPLTKTLLVILEEAKPT